MSKRLKGLNLDVDEIDQPQGTYSYAENALLSKRIGAISSEEGNELQDSIPNGYTIIGHTLVYDGRIILFLADGSNSEIGVFNGNNYSAIFNNSELNFQVNSVVEATTRIDNNEDVIVYWTDNINPPRYLNIDDVPTISNINMLNIFSFIDDIPVVDLDSVNSSGGTLNTGAYYFFVAYIDENGNKTNYLSSSSPVYITDDVNLTDVDNYDGAPANTPTGKSISITISNIDTNYERLEVSVLAREENTTRYVRILPHKNISSDSIRLTYTGTESFTDGAIEDIIINNASYATARTLTQIDDILYLGNLSKKQDIGYQKFANNIEVEVDSEVFESGVSNGQNNYKNAEVSYDSKSYKRDEVYAFYISFILDDGVETTAYHIPGRQNLHAQEVADVSDFPTELAEENIIDSTNGKRYHFENRSNESGLNTGFWENNNEFYPDNENWEIWDVNSSGNGVKIGSLRPSENPNPIPVRHHRMPSVDHFPFHNEFGDIIPIGVRFNNIKIPSDIREQVRGIKIYYANRTQGNRRIIGQSFIYQLLAGPVDGSTEDFYIPDVGGSGVGNAFGSMDFKMMNERPSIGEFTHIKITGYPQGELDDVFTDGSNNYDLYNMVNGNTQNQGNYALGNIIVNDASNGGNTITITFDGTPNNNTYAVNINVDGTETPTSLAGKIQTAINNHSTLETFYTASSTDEVVEVIADEGGADYNATLTVTQADGANIATNDIANGKDTGTNLSVDGAAKAYVPHGQEVVELQSKGFEHDGHTGYSESGMWFELTNDYSYVVSPIPRTVTGAGHIGITADIMAHKLNLYDAFDAQELIDTGYHTVDIDNFDPQNGGATFQTSLIFGGDTYINRYAFRLSEDQLGSVNHKAIYYYVCESYDNVDLRHEGSEYEQIYYPKSDALDVLELEEQDEVEDFYDNFYGYNPDYSALQNIKTTPPTDKNLDDERISYVTRIIRSQQDDPVEEIDRFRQFLENDYIDLPRNRGELVKLSKVDNILIPHMERAIIRTKGREELVTGDFRAYLGAGDIFATSPDEIHQTEEGFGGLQDQRCAITTPYGYFYVDREARQVIILSDGLEIISDNGLRNFFEQQLSQTGEDELICTWDNKFERIILSRKGNWTVSYYPTQKLWGSFHSYQPDYYMYDVNTFYSLNQNDIYQHNISTNSCTFYGSTEDFIFEFVDNRSPQESKYIGNIQFISEVENASGDKFYDETFTSFRISNNYQDSGLQDIIYFDNPDGNARHVEGTWKINRFRDMLVNGSIDPNKPWTQQTRLIGKYGKVRLIYNNSGNKFLYLYDTKLGLRKSFR